MNDSQNGIKVIDQILLLKKMGAVGLAALEESLDADETLLYADASGILKFKSGGNTVSVGASSGVTNYSLKSANYTVTDSDGMVDNDTADTTITLLSAAGITGQEFTISNSSGGNITVNTTSSQTIYLPGGTVTSVILSDGESLTVVSTGSNYRAK